MFILPGLIGNTQRNVFDKAVVAGATYVLTDQKKSSAAGATHTFTTTAIGTATATRTVLVLAAGWGAASAVTGITIDGVAANLVTGTDVTSFSFGQGAFALNVTSGTTATIAVTFAGSMALCGIRVYCLDGVNSTFTQADADVGYGASQTNSVTIPSGGFAISFSLFQNNTSAGTFSNCVEDGSLIYLDTASLPMQSAHNVTAGAQTPTMTPPGSDVIMMTSIAYGP